MTGGGGAVAAAAAAASVELRGGLAVSYAEPWWPPAAEAAAGETAAVGICINGAPPGPAMIISYPVLGTNEAAETEAP